jgi:uncharacterized protein (DUF305 family)
MDDGMTERFAALAVAAVLAAACGSAPPAAAPPAPPAPVVQAGAPGEASRPVHADEVARMASPRHVAADARFMRDMIVHHAQAVEMTELVAERTASEDIRMLARRIEASQEDEMALMRNWLQDRREALPDPHAHHAPHAHHEMAGMLSPAEMSQLRAARGAEFDRLFLDFMIRHHEGAIVMVEQLFATDGAGQEIEIFQFASHVDSDQRMEIDRMRRMLAARR